MNLNKLIDKIPGNYQVKMLYKYNRVIHKNYYEYTIIADVKDGDNNSVYLERTSTKSIDDAAKLMYHSLSAILNVLKT